MTKVTDGEVSNITPITIDAITKEPSPEIKAIVSWGSWIKALVGITIGLCTLIVTITLTVKSYADGFARRAEVKEIAGTAYDHEIRLKVTEVRMDRQDKENQEFRTEVRAQLRWQSSRTIELFSRLGMPSPPAPPVGE